MVWVLHFWHKAEISLQILVSYKKQQKCYYPAKILMASASMDPLLKIGITLATFQSLGVFLLEDQQFQIWIL